MAIIFDKSLSRTLIATVMVIDDQLTSRIILETIVQSIGDNIKVKSYDNAMTALKVAESDPPDLIIADYKMPGMDGVEFSHRIRRSPSCQDIPIIIITIVDERAIMYEALEAGATDFLTKPVDHYECKVRCRNLLTIRRQQQIIKNRANSLEHQVNESIEQLHLREIEIINRLAMVGDHVNHHDNNYHQRIGEISSIISKDMGLDDEFCQTIKIAAQLRDIGNATIPDHILLKPESLDENEFEIVKGHAKAGYDILKDGLSPYLKMGAIIALNHHERFDGEGYPAGIAGHEIPVEARIVAVADVFCAMAIDRPYRKARTLDEIKNELTRLLGEQFDPECLSAFFSGFDKIVASQKELISNNF